MKSTIEHIVRLAQIRDTVNRDKASTIVVTEETTATEFLQTLIDQSYLYPRNSDLKRQPYLIVTPKQVMLLIADAKVFEMDKDQRRILTNVVAEREAKLMHTHDLISDEDVELACQEDENVAKAYQDAAAGMSMTEIEANNSVKFNYETGRFVTTLVKEDKAND